MNNNIYAFNMKLIGPCRNQLEMQFNYLDMLLPQDHLARSVWQFVEAMDTRPCFSYINTFVGHEGRSSTSPKILFALWIYSILDGNNSARKLAELCKNHNAYKWIAGGAPINRTMLAEFRSKDPMKFEELLTTCLAVMLKADLISDVDFSQDGTRVKANAGFNSFRREESLEKLKNELSLYIKQVVTNSNGYDKRNTKKELAVSFNRLKRVKEALNTLNSEREIKKTNSKTGGRAPTENDLKQMRASTTDPAVRKMRMGDGGFRLAYNVQFATGMVSRVVYGVDVVTSLDPGTSPKMMSQVYSRLSKLNMSAPKNWVADAAYSSKRDLNTVSKMFPDCKYYAPPQVNKGIDPKKYHKSDSEAVRNWRDMIGTEEVEELYKSRCSTAEFSNAQVKNRGLKEFVVRGLEKVKGMAFLHAIAQNISRYLDLLNKREVLVNN